VEIEVQEGRKREVRRIFEALGYFVEKLIRIRVGPISLGALPQGEIRPLTSSEVLSLKKELGLLGRPAKGSSDKRREGRGPLKHKGRP
jgi:23S rRNA pseudouridine2605 synthase